MKKIVIICFAAFTFTACNHTDKEPEYTTEVEEEVTDVTLTDEQVKKLGISFGEMPNHEFSGEIEANGKLAVAPQSQASVSPCIGGNVKQILVHEGQKVNKGQLLAWISHPDLLDVQSRYLEAHNRLIYVASEYERQKKLYQEHVGSGKDYQQILSEYRLLQGQLRTTSAQLQMMGINPTSIANGKTFTSVALRAPITGTIEQINAVTGQYVDSQTTLFHIVNFNDIYADLLVFEKDLPKIKVGQQVVFELKSACGDKFTGRITSIGKIFNDTPKATHVRATIEGGEHEFAEGFYLCGKIASDSQLTKALSTEGLVDNAGKTYAFTATHEKGIWTFHPVEVTKGREEKGFVEIVRLNESVTNTQFALNGSYYILSEMKKAETGEED
ncbi:efflux RND transporter periplasmic adaptor subunit [Prevotella sp. P6B1]|uniref:efflux RND transporter periplasmic adaptor subunit n=1 Tax=Prevotella sp. P6B1 TaxID=1410613 RepID=UPI00051CA661|nr:efflux RND transporter periplasmic adaptor subunit [Prevotella sp. P6B1]